MDDFFKRDPRIEDGTPLRDLEKKLHWTMFQLAQAGIALDLSGGAYSFPDDLNSNDIQNDAMSVATTEQHNCGLTAGGGGSTK
jgi:hypothetical protein